MRLIGRGRAACAGLVKKALTLGWKSPILASFFARRCERSVASIFAAILGRSETLGLTAVRKMSAVGGGAAAFYLGANSLL